MSKRTASTTPAAKPAKSKSGGKTKKIGFRDKVKVKSGVVNYVFKPKDNDLYNFGELEVEKEWPARLVSQVKVPPTGSPAYLPGQSVHWSIVVPANCFIRFSKEAICGVVGLIMNAVAAAGQPPGDERLLPLRPQAAEDEVGPDADAADPRVAVHKFIPENPSGIILPLIEKLELMIQNQVVKCNELGGGALQRYSALSNRSAKIKFGPDMTASEINYYLPQVDADLDYDAPSDTLRKKCKAARRGKYQRFVGRSPVYGFPFNYDPVAKQLNKKPSLDSFYFGPGTHIELRLYLASSFSRGIRSLDASNPILNDQQRRDLWARQPRLTIDALWLQIDKQCFPQNSPFLKQLQDEFQKSDAREIPFTDANELRTPLYARMTEQSWNINLHQLGYPLFVYVYFASSDEIDGANGRSVNANAFKFPPNLESFDVTYQNTSLLPGGQVTKLDLPGTDTADKLMFFDHQKQFRRVPGTYEQFYDESLSQYALVDLSSLYLQDHKLTELDHIHISLKFNNQLSPQGYQIGLIAVTEKKLVLKPSGEHSIVNAAGKPQIQG